MSTYVMPVHRVHMVVSEWNVMGYVSCDGGEGDLFCRMVCLHECEQWHNDREHPCGPEEAPHTLVPLPADKDCCVVTGLDAQGVVDSHEGQPRGQTAYRHPKRGKAHRIDIPLDPQPDPWDQAYSGLTGCGFRLRWAFPVSTNVAAPEDLCRVCWPKEAT